jgi:hypothetical protein
VQKRQIGGEVDDLGFGHLDEFLFSLGGPPVPAMDQSAI